MGTSSSLKNNRLIVAANFIMKLQIAALQAAASNPEEIQLYPMIDGIYFTTPTKQTVVDFIGSVFGELARHFLLPNQRDFRFLIRGGVAYGQVVHGMNAVGRSLVLSNAPDYRKRVLIGLPLIEAYEIERQAPPFGVAVAGSAQSHWQIRTGQTIQTFDHPHLQWWDNGDRNLITARQLKPQVLQEIDDLALRSEHTGYPIESVLRHKTLIKDYLPD